MRLLFDLDLQKLVIGANTTQELLSISVKRSPNALIEIQFLRGVTPQELAAGATGIFEVKETGKYDANSIFRSGSWVKTGSGETTIYTFTLDVSTTAGDIILGVEDPVTFTTAFATDLFSAAASPPIGTIIQFSTSADDLPAPLLTNTDYYVVTAGHTATDWKVSLTSEGTPVNLTDNGTGTHQFRKISDDVASVNLMAAMQYVADGNTVESQTFVFVYQNDIVRDGDTSPVADPEDVIVAVRAGKVAIASGTDAGTISFSSPFDTGASVAIVLTVLKPGGGDNFFATYDIDSILEEAGFNYTLSGVVPATGYKISYIAVAI